MTAEGLGILVPRLIVMQSATPWDDVQTEVWARSLRHIPDDIALAAMDNLWATEKWRPAFSEFLAEVIAITDPVPSLREAQETIRKMVTGRGARECEHGAVLAAIAKMGGLAVIGRMESKRLEESMPTIWIVAVNEWKDSARKQIVSGKLDSDVLPGFVSALAQPGLQAIKREIEGMPR